MNPGLVPPRDFAAYVRVLHPVELDDGQTSLTWAQVCQLTGRVPHALMQWAAIATPTAESNVETSLSGLWDDGSVRVGSLAPSALSALIDAPPGLDAWPVYPDDDLTAFADLLNSSA